MFGITYSKVRHLLHPYYITNLLLSTIFFILKTVPFLCVYVFADCEMEMREWELVTFFGCVLVAKNRKQANYVDYISTAMMFGKLLSVVMFFRQNPLYAIIYGLVCILHLVCINEPCYSGPEDVTYFRGQSLEDELAHGDKRITWIIEFYAAWSPQCVRFAPIFSELSHKYGLDNLKFGKLDVNRYQKIAEKFKIDYSSWTKELPTIIVFQNGKEKERRPQMYNQKIVKFAYNQESVIKEFSLNELYHQCKQNPIKKKEKPKPEHQKAE